MGQGGLGRSHQKAQKILPLCLHFKNGNAIVFLLAFEGGEIVAKSKTPAKRARRAEANRIRNKAQKSRLKTTIRKYEATIKEVNVDAAGDNLQQAISLIDKSVSKGIMHKNTAARRKSKLAKKFNQINAQ
ncbi:MAG: 30S ribosomal protein S20 [Syntrophomonadaceae bacterium]|nr:30S ribosomal protein S20 [Syntrophomonadaceae bacterium]